MRILAAVVVVVGMVVAAPQALAQADANEERNALSIAAQFTRLAGSEENALALVKALRNGARVTLVAEASGTKMPVMTTFELPPGTMSWDNVMITLALARDGLTRAGILYPTGEELEAALLGGDVATTRGNVRLTGSLIK